MTQQLTTATSTDLFNRSKLFIGGRWTSSSTRGTIEITDPYSEEVIGAVPEANAADTDAAIAAAVRALRDNPWQRMSFDERGDVLARVAELLVERNTDVETTYIKDQGGIRSFAAYIAGQAADIFAEHKKFSGELYAEQWRENGGERNLIKREPVGPVLAIVPWNAPLVLAAVKLAPALLAGCPVVMKAAVEDPSVSFILAEVLEAAGVPEGMVSILPGNPDALGDIAARPEFAHIAFTGSTASGRRIMHTAADNITDVVLELGGKSAGIFLDDLDPAHGAQLVIPGSLAQSGQVCTTYSRLLLPESRRDEWIGTLIATFQSLPVGDPDDPATVIGPLISAGHRDRVEGYIQSARDEGATILTGGKRPNLPHGYFVEPTLITDVTPEMRIVREEVFGPVITVQSYRNLDEAVEIANSSEFGLGAGIFTADTDAGLALAPRLQAGNVAINNFGACLMQPFGGYKSSGLGREGGIENVEHLLAFKQVRMPMQLPL
ncbi:MULTISPECIES: aldehyde dehydrogenase family protein [Nocardia]|jgi:aldehyde dehydrogenase (NAD+)|uniref:aldehyde dehydrogenase family protein n=1 Tax=Nocardia abscessus TaxID=120957 RepID=UPI001893FF18|nr:aldehyde dehydrogenase family protein [Nocardia abscessus]MBF6472462.1 aldehyde dehydrogenase family protein [Nocardia abscessus]